MSEEEIKELENSINEKIKRTINRIIKSYLR